MTYQIVTSLLDAILLIPLLWISQRLVLGTTTIWFILLNELERTELVRYEAVWQTSGQKLRAEKLIDLWSLPDLLPFTFFYYLHRVLLKSICKIFIVLILICVVCQESVRPQLDESQITLKTTVNQHSPKLTGIHSWLAASLCVLNSTIGTEVD